jgi:hypothetical protein
MIIRYSIFAAKIEIFHIKREKKRKIFYFSGSGAPPRRDAKFCVSTLPRLRHRFATTAEARRYTARGMIL